MPSDPLEFSGEVISEIYSNNNPDCNFIFNDTLNSSNTKMTSKSNSNFHSKHLIIFSIISKYILSPVVAKTIVNHLDSLENGQSITLTNLLINIPSRIRPDKTAKEQLIQELSDSNLFSIRRPRQNSFVISKTSHYV